VEGAQVKTVLLVFLASDCTKKGSPTDSLCRWGTYHREMVWASAMLTSQGINAKLVPVGFKDRLAFLASDVRSSFAEVCGRGG